jgi:hypothetical protein
MEVEAEPNVYEQYEEYVKQVEVKQSDDISAEVDDEKNADVISRSIYYSVKTLCTTGYEKVYTKVLHKIYLSCQLTFCAHGHAD